jgi:hypothetical protein
LYLSFNRYFLNSSNFTRFHIPVYDFQSLDKFIADLATFNLIPHLEFMTSLRLKSRSDFVWEDFSYQILSHYLDIYGVETMKSWKLETWNEPDLKGYNVLKFEFMGESFFEGSIIKQRSSISKILQTI